MNLWKLKIYENLINQWVSQIELVVMNQPANTGDIKDADLIPGLGRTPGKGNVNPLQFSCLENSEQQKTEKPGRLQYMGPQRV